MSTETTTPKKSLPTRIMEAAENAKPSNLDDEKKETVLRRIKITAAFAAGILATVTTVATVSYYKSFSEAEGETSDEETVTED
jgi:hypothetical protein